MTEKIWETRCPKKGEVAEFVTNDGNKIVGFYWGLDKEKSKYILSDAVKSKRDIYLVIKENVMFARILR